jgi:hypothetical protein
MISIFNCKCFKKEMLRIILQIKSFDLRKFNLSVFSILFLIVIILSFVIKSNQGNYFILSIELGQVKCNNKFQ